jgi:hypothetical protein
MSKEEEDDDNIVIQGDVEETAQVQEEEEGQGKEKVEVAEGQELEVLPKNEEEEQQQQEEILLTEAISTTTPKRPKVAKMKPSVWSQHKEKTLANISEQLQKQSAKIDKV